MKKKPERKKDLKRSPKGKARHAPAPQPKTWNLKKGFLSWWEEKSVILRFLGLFSLMLLIFYIFWNTSFYQEGILGFWNGINAKAGAAILGIFGQGTSAAGGVITSPICALEVKQGCDALEPIAVFIFLVIAFPTDWRYKLRGILYGTALMALINLIRIISLFIIMKFWPAAFEFFHIEIWQMVFILLSLSIWIYWLNKRLNSPNENTTAEPTV